MYREYSITGFDRIKLPIVPVFKRFYGDLDVNYPITFFNNWVDDKDKSTIVHEYDLYDNRYPSLIPEGFTLMNLYGFDLYNFDKYCVSNDGRVFCISNGNRCIYQIPYLNVSVKNISNRIRYFNKINGNSVILSVGNTNKTFINSVKSLVVYAFTKYNSPYQYYKIELLDRDAPDRYKLNLSNLNIVPDDKCFRGLTQRRFKLVRHFSELNRVEDLNMEEWFKLLNLKFNKENILKFIYSLENNIDIHGLYIYTK